MELTNYETFSIALISFREQSINQEKQIEEDRYRGKKRWKKDEKRKKKVVNLKIFDDERERKLS